MTANPPSQGPEIMVPWISPPALVAPFVPWSSATS